MYILYIQYTYILYYDVDGLRINFFCESHSGATGLARFLEVSILYIYILYISSNARLRRVKLYTFFFGGGGIGRVPSSSQAHTHVYCTASCTSSDDLWFSGNFCVYEMFTPSSVYIYIYTRRGVTYLTAICLRVPAPTPLPSEYFWRLRGV